MRAMRALRALLGALAHRGVAHVVAPLIPAAVAAHHVLSYWARDDQRARACRISAVRRLHGGVRMILYGSSLSPYTRKVLAYAGEKGIELDLQPTGFTYPIQEFPEACP